MHFITSTSVFGISLDAYLIMIMIGIPIFFIWRRLFRKKIQNQNRRIVITWLITLISAPIVYFLFIAAIVIITMYYPDHRFNRDEWMNDKDTRYEYVDNIIKSKMLIGKDSTTVEKLLGADHSNEQYGGWFYDLGFTPGSIDPDSMEIIFKNGRVVDVIKHSHH